jgi:replicative DNA helicase
MKATSQTIEFDPLKHGLPVADEAERFLLGSCLRFGRIGEVVSRITADDFALENHRVLWGMMRELHEAGEEVNYSTVAMRLARHRQDIERVGGLGYVIELAELLPDRPNIEAYFREIRDKSMRRRLILKCNETMIRLADKTEDSIGIAPSNLRTSRVTAPCPSLVAADFPPSRKSSWTLGGSTAI